ncbi:MAG TPA: glycine oxidase ThiO [Planctomycetaceae bacterium]|jgi:glycine oxidase|nr:glycine oxidase ThiO [Planctomycetaceae bacterium]
MDDVIVIGGGVIGLSVALELAGQGAAVTVLEQADFGREASWAGAGILPPGNLDAAVSPEARLRALSHSLWPDWSESLAAETGIEIGYTRCGGLELRTGTGAEDSVGDLASEIECWRSQGVRVEELDADALREVEPLVNPETVGAYRLPDLGQVRNPRLMKALLAACAARGVRLRAGTPAIGLEEQGGESEDEGTSPEDKGRRVDAVRTHSGRVQAGRYLITGGAWSRGLLASVGVDVAIAPVRGQMMLLSQASKPFSHVLQTGSRYLVPRDDGRILIGSTEEHVGFFKANTASAVSELLAFGVSRVPSLAHAKFERAWSGLRPGSGDGLPYLGRIAGFDNLFIAAGHFRNGLQMSPGTARLTRQALLDQDTDIPLEPFQSDRHQGEGSRLQESSSVGHTPPRAST